MHDGVPFYSLIDGYSASCHSACSCGEQGFNPVCGADHIVYYSACHAGCSAKSEDSMVSIHRTRNKGTLVLLQELSVALQEEWQQILKAAKYRIISSMPGRCPARGGHFSY